MAHADPAAEYPAAALALGARFELASAGGTRTVPAAEFFTGFWSTAAEPDELLRAISFPVWGEGSGFGVAEFARRHGDFAIAGAVAAIQVDGAGAIARSAVDRVRRRGHADRRRGRGRPGRHGPRRRRRRRTGGAGRRRVRRRHRRSAGAGGVPAARRRRRHRRRLAPRRAPISRGRRHDRRDHGPGDRQRVRPAAAGGAAQDARRCAPRGPRPHRHPPRLRARRVRGVHHPRGWRGGAVVPDVRRPGRRHRRS